MRMLVGLLALGAGGPAVAQTRVYIAPDDHTDFIWSGTEAEYERYFNEMLDYHMGRADADIAANVDARFQNRFTADGTYWLWVYAKTHTADQFAHIIDRIKSGHLGMNMTPLDIMQGAMPAEAVLRQMYYAGSLERAYNFRFPMAWAMENQTMTLGVASLWAGAGVRYSWSGVCNCATSAPGLSGRQYEIYRWSGLDGSSVLTKWYSILNSNTSLGGYAEAHDTESALATIKTAAFTNRYRPSGGSAYSVVGLFGSGWDDRETVTSAIRDTARSLDSATYPITISNMADFFTDFEKTYGNSIPSQSVSFGIEWDRAPASLAEVSAIVKRSVEKLRAAEAMATITSLEDPNFMSTRTAARDKMQIDLGLYFEHDFTNGGPGATVTERTAFQRRIAKEISDYVDTLFTDAKSSLGTLIKKQGSKPRIFVFNPLSFQRTDVVDYSYTGAVPVRLIDVGTQTEVPSQVVGTGAQQRIRIEAHDIPAYGYRVFELDSTAPGTISNPVSVDATNGKLASPFFQVTVNGSGAITSLLDTTHQGREVVRKSGLLNSLATGTGTLAVEDVGPVSATLVASSSAGIDHTSRVTVYHGVPRVAIVDEITKNFVDERGYKFDFALTDPDTWHEEVGAVIRARLTSNGGHYATRNAKYDYLPFNHFAAMSGADGFGVTLSNGDVYIMKLGNSTVSTLDTATPSLTAIAGGVYDSIQSQGGDSDFVEHFAIGTYSSYSAVASMRFALEHQNPLVAGDVTGTVGTYPETAYSLLKISDANVLGWALKPAQDRGNNRVAVRLWNLGAASSSVDLTFARDVTTKAKTTHVETPLTDTVSGSGNVT